jgi:hypothetical protein
MQSPRKWYSEKRRGFFNSFLGKGQVQNPPSVFSSLEQYLFRVDASQQPMYIIGKFDEH